MLINKHGPFDYCLLICLIKGFQKTLWHCVDSALHVQISLESAQEGRLITKFVANFCIKKHEGETKTQFAGLHS